MRRGVIAGAARHRAGEVGDPQAVPLRIRILRFDRLTPAPYHVEEAALESTRPSVQVDEVTAGAQLFEQLVRAIDRLHRLAVAPLSREQFGEFARHLGLQQDVLPHRRERRTKSNSTSASSIWPRSRAMIPRCLRSSASARASPIACASGRARAQTASASSIRPRDELQLRHVPHQEEVRRTVPLALGEFRGTPVRRLGLVPLAEVGVQHPKVVERPADFARHAQLLEGGDAFAIVPQRAGQVAAHVGDEPAVLRGHRAQARVARLTPQSVRLEVELVGRVEIAALPEDDRADIEHAPFGRVELRTRRHFAGDLEAVERRVRVAIELPGAGDAAERVGHLLGLERGRPTAQRLLVERARQGAVPEAFLALAAQDHLPRLVARGGIRDAFALFGVVIGVHDGYQGRPGTNGRYPAARA